MRDNEFKGCPLAGTITRSYDALDRLISEVTPQGSVAYAYDAAGRRTSMTVSGQSAVNYSYDNANHLTQITQGSATVTIVPDADGRRQSLTLPNGLSMNYGYDAASQLTGITYKLGATTLGNLAYTYDLAGRRTGVGGSYARSNVPQTVSSAAYNVNNQLSNWKGTNFTYDADGNLTNDGTNTYTWNARNQLVSISGAASASFQYDAFGRRVSKTIGATTQFLYDGANPVQEISGTSVSANLLTGDLDEYFQRTDSAGARSFLTDALGSTAALADSTGTVQTSYTFDPFGNTTTTGAVTTNSFAYTGRELDATGLYFYRARYYSPTLQRFVSEDPVGFLGGANLYRYVSNRPTDLTDPHGLLTPVDTAIAAGAGAILAVGAQVISDIGNGQRSSVSTYIGAIAGGAVAGAITVNSFNPAIAGAAGGAFGNLVKQDIDLALGDGPYGRASTFDPEDLVKDTAIGGVTGGIERRTSLGGLPGALAKGSHGAILGGFLDSFLRSGLAGRKPESEPLPLPVLPPMAPSCQQLGECDLPGNQIPF